MGTEAAAMAKEAENANEIIHYFAQEWAPGVVIHMQTMYTVSYTHLALMQSFWPGPLTLIVAKSDLIPDEVSAGLDTVGVRMPSHPIAARLIKETGRPIAAPSANISGKPSPTDASAVWDDMQGKIAGVIDGGSCGIGVESTVVDTTSARCV